MRRSFFIVCSFLAAGPSGPFCFVRSRRSIASVVWMTNGRRAEADAELQFGALKKHWFAQSWSSAFLAIVMSPRLWYSLVHVPRHPQAALHGFAEGDCDSVCW